MCEPVSIALAGASVLSSAVSAGLSIAGDAQRHDMEEDHTRKQVEANRVQMQENRDMATRSFLDKAYAINQDLSQTRQATAQDNFLKSIASAKARGEVMAAAAESGVSGNSLDVLLKDFMRQEAFLKQANNQNLLFKEQQAATHIKAAETEAINRTKSIKPFIPAPIQPVDYIGPALSVVGGGLGTASKFVKFPTIN